MERARTSIGGIGGSGGSGGGGGDAGPVRAFACLGARIFDSGVPARLALACSARLCSARLCSARPTLPVLCDAAVDDEAYGHGRGAEVAALQLAIRSLIHCMSVHGGKASLQAR